MTLTTDPRDRGAGQRVRVSRTDAGKRDALVGRIVRHVIQPIADPASRTVVHARILCADPFLLGRIVPPTSRDQVGRLVRLGDVLTLLDCPTCHYTAGHWRYCPRKGRA